MSINRRSILAGFGALLSTTSLVRAFPPSRARGPIPVVYGDGVNDDAPGLNAASNGLPFHDLTGHVRRTKDGLVVLDGTFLVCTPLVINGDVRNNHWTLSGVIPKQGALLEIRA
jgi:hypothetical protein